MKINLILAVDEKNGLWKNWKLAWDIPTDLKHFKEITSNTEDLAKLNAVIMWRKTWESIPVKFKPLSDRINCIITKSIKTNHIGSKIDDFTLFFNSIMHCLSELESKENLENIFIIGWASLYNDFLKWELLKFVDKIYLTKVKWDFWCDVFFDWIPKSFKVEKYSDEIEENGYTFSFWEYKKIKEV